MTYKQLENTYVEKTSSTQDAKRRMQQSSPFMTPGYTAKVPPQSYGVVANYKPYTEKYQYNTLLHVPPSQRIQSYNSSGYFKVTQAYLSECTLTQPRQCDPPFHRPSSSYMS